MPAVSALAIFATHPELPLRSFAANEVLLSEGPATGRIYVLASGEVDVLKGDVAVARIVEPGAIFGEISALLGVGHSATVRAATAATAYEIADAARFLDGSPELMRSVATLLARRLMDATTYLTDLKHQYSDREDHFVMVDQILEALVNQQDVQPASGVSRSSGSRSGDGRL
jgi:CRP/FNR family transcriptional regulator, cyclic AMP receptor protein